MACRRFAARQWPAARQPVAVFSRAGGFSDITAWVWFAVQILLLSSLLGPTAGLAQSSASIARHWQVHSFFDDAKLVEKAVTFGDVGPDGTIWLAVSDGLYKFDGYRWTRFTTEHGLPSNYVRSVLVASDGKVWIGTDQGAGVFDGESFDASGTDGKLAGPSVRRIVEDPDGSLWFCCDQWPLGDMRGGLTRLSNGRFTTWTQKEGLPSNYVSDYVRDSQGRQFVLTNKGLVQMTDAGLRQPLQEAGLWDADTYVWSLVESEQHGLIVSTDPHFYQFHDGQWTRRENTLANLTQPKLLASSDGEVFTCTQGRGPTILRWTDRGFVPASRRLIDITGGVDVMFEDRQGAIWIAGFERLLRWERRDSEWQVLGDVGSPIMKDSGNTIWFSASRDGLVRRTDGQWQSVPGMSEPIREDLQGRVWMHSPDGLAIWENDRVNSVDLAPLSDPHLLSVDSQGMIWISAKDEQESPVIAGYDGDDWHVQSLSAFGNRTRVCRCVPDPESGVWIVLSASNLPPFDLAHFDLDAQRQVALPARVQVSNPPQVLKTKDGTLLLGGFFGLLEQKPATQQWSEIESPSRTVSQIRALNDEVWISCRGQIGGQAALSRRRGGDWQPFLQWQGLFVGRDGNEKLFASSLGKIHVVKRGTDSFGPPISTTPFQARATSVVAGNAGEMWVGVANRSYRYTPKQSPPETEILGGNQNLSEDEPLVLYVRGIERFKPHYLGREFLVSMQWDGGDWTPFEKLTGKIRVANSGIGEHIIRVRVQDASQKIDLTPATFRYRVLPIPLQSRSWFWPAVTMCFLAILGLASLAGFNWTRVNRLARSLEREVARKTNSLRLSEREFRLLFEDSQDAICLFSMDGTLQSCNGAARELLGLRAGEELSISEIFSDRNEESRFQRELKLASMKGTKYRMRNKSGDCFDAILSVNTRADESGKDLGYQVIIRDISPLVDLQERLSETKKMEAVGRMAGGIAHDFNNFLAVVMYGAEFVRFNADEDEGIEKGVQMIMDAAERGRTLTSQIQTFSRAPIAKLGVIDPREVLSKIPEMLQAVVTPGIELDCRFDDSLGHVRADQAQLEQVIINLAVNARHAMPQGGRLTVTASNVDVSDAQAREFKLDRGGEYLLLSVRDTGLGMDAATCERIFDPFFTTKPQGQGTGLGLAIVYGIVQQFKGQIRVDSKLGEGTCFEIYLPRCPDDAVADTLDNGIDIPARGSESVLLVEDEPSLRELVQRSLTSLGYLVELAENGTDARRILESRDHFDLVISDIVMPGTTGLELVKWLRSVDSDVACLLISGYADPMANGTHQEIDVPFLKKPFHPAVLASRVREILDSRVPAPDV